MLLLTQLRTHSLTCAFYVLGSAAYQLGFAAYLLNPTAYLLNPLHTYTPSIEQFITCITLDQNKTLRHVRNDGFAGVCVCESNCNAHELVRASE